MREKTTIKMIGYRKGEMKAESGRNIKKNILKHIIKIMKKSIRRIYSCKEKITRKRLSQRKQSK